MSTVLCRVCINPCQQSEMAKMFDEANRPLALAVMLSEIGGIQIPSTEQDTRLPRFCCPGCTDRLKDANELRKLCQESDKKLRKMMKSVVKDEVDAAGLLEQTMEETLDSERAPDGQIKQEEVELEPGYSVSSDKNSDDDGNDPDFVEEEPKSKKQVKAKKTVPKKKMTKNGKRTPGTAQREKKVFQCCHCGKTCSTKFILEQHESSHLQQLPLKCHLCPRSYAFSNSLAEHLKTHDPNRSYKCSQCDKVMKTEAGFRFHMESHSAEPEFKCSLCPKAYSRRSTLYQHVQHTHRKRRPFKCDLCPKEFPSKYKLKLHYGPAHEGISLYPCPHCAKKYHSSNYLAQHVAERHPEQVDNLSQCAFCGKGYASNNHYRKHVSKQHPERMAEFEVLVKKG